MAQKRWDFWLKNYGIARRNYGILQAATWARVLCLSWARARRVSSSCWTRGERAAGDCQRRCRGGVGVGEDGRS